MDDHQTSSPPPLLPTAWFTKMDPMPPIINTKAVPPRPTETPPPTEDLRTTLNHQYAAVRTKGMPMNKEAYTVTPSSPPLVDPTRGVAGRIALMENDEEEEEFLGVMAAMSTLEVLDKVEIELKFREDFDANEPVYQVFIKTLTGKTITVDFSPGDDIALEG